MRRKELIAGLWWFVTNFLLFWVSFCFWQGRKGKIKDKTQKFFILIDIFNKFCNSVRTNWLLTTLFDKNRTHEILLCKNFFKITQTQNVEYKKIVETSQKITCKLKFPSIFYTFEQETKKFMNLSPSFKWFIKLVKRKENSERAVK